MELLLAHAGRFDVTGPRADELVFQMAETISASWREAARAAGMSKGEIEAYDAAFAHREMDVATARAVRPLPHG